MEPVKQCPEEGINDKQVNIICSEAFPLARGNGLVWQGMRVVDKDLGSNLANTEVATEAGRSCEPQTYWIALTFGTLSKGR